MWLLLVVSMGLAGELEWPIDLDGDGKKEMLEYPSSSSSEEEGDEEETIRLGKTVISYHYEFPTTVKAIDLKHGDGSVEVMLCESGPRDDSDCSLHRYVKNKLVPIPWSGAAQVSHFTASGSGIVLAHSNASRLYTRIDKGVLQADGTIKPVPQPFYRVGHNIKIDRTFPITMSPGGGAVVANVRPGSEITALVSDGGENFLFQISSGLVGWASLDDLMKASDYIQMMYSAG